MTAVAYRELAVGQVTDAFQVPPVSPASGRSRRVNRAKLRFGVQLKENARLDGCDLPPSPFEEQDLVETMPSQRTHPIADSAAIKVEGRKGMIAGKPR